jgi:GT2 family glycosyltransferase
MKNKSPILSVIICTYNTKKITCECLDNLKRSIDFSKEIVEVVVVENGTDGTGKVIKNKYPWVKLVVPDTNTGYAMGNNLGISVSDKNSKFYLFLNSDVLVNEDTLRKSIDYFEINSKCDVLGCKLLYGDGRFQPSGGYFPSPQSVFTWILGIDLIPIASNFLRSFHQKNPIFFNKNREVDWVMGAYFFMKRKVVEKTHGFDENLFMYMEEVEWCRRIKDLGFKIWYTPDFQVTHLDKTSSKDDGDNYRKIAQKEILGVNYFIQKYYPSWYAFVRGLIVFGLLVRSLVFFVLGNRDRYQTYKESIKLI